MSPSTLHRALQLGIVALALCLTACSGQKPDADQQHPSLSEVLQQGPSPAPSEFCNEIDDVAIQAALTTTEHTTNHYANGERADIAPGVNDVAHEYNCTFASTDGTTARAWVFVPPVGADRAAQLVKATLNTPSCARYTSQDEAAQTFGSPGVFADCGTSVTLRGLFGHTWFACSLTAPSDSKPDPTELRERTERWCASTLAAAS